MILLAPQHGVDCADGVVVRLEVDRDSSGWLPSRAGECTPQACSSLSSR